jgi:hypothetical protein
LKKTGIDNSAVGNIVTINGAPKSYYDLPYSFWADNGTIIFYSYNGMVSSAISGKRFNLLSVISPNAQLIVTEPATIIGSYKTQYFLSVRTDPAGIATIPGEDWYDALQNVTLTAVTVPGYKFEYWDVDGASFAVGVTTVTVFMDSPRTYFFKFLTFTISVWLISCHLRIESIGQSDLVQFLSVEVQFLCIFPLH